MSLMVITKDEKGSYYLPEFLNSCAPSGLEPFCITYETMDSAGVVSVKVHLGLTIGSESIEAIRKYLSDLDEIQIISIEKQYKRIFKSKRKAAIKYVDGVPEEFIINLSELNIVSSEIGAIQNEQQH